MPQVREGMGGRRLGERRGREGQGPSGHSWMGTGVPGGKPGLRLWGVFSWICFHSLPTK